MSRRGKHEKPSAGRTGLFLPLLYAAVPAALTGICTLIWGRELKDLLSAMIKLVVKA